MQHHQSRLVEFRLADAKQRGCRIEIGVVITKAHGFTDAQAATDEQADERRVRVRAQRAAGAQGARPPQQRGDLRVREDVWHWPPRRVEQPGGGDLSLRLRGAYVREKAANDAQASRTIATATAGMARPVNGELGGRGVGLPARLGECDEVEKESIAGAALVSVRLSQSDVSQRARPQVIGAHDAAFGHGSATRANVSTSSLA